MPTKGKKTPPEVRRKLSEAAKKRVYSFEHKQRMRRNLKDNPSVREGKARVADKRFPHSCIYIMALKRYPGLYKVGTAQDPGDRTRKLRAFLPFDHSRMIAYIRVKGAYKKEIELVGQFPSNGELVRAELGELLAELRRIAGEPLCMVQPLWYKNNT